MLEEYFELIALRREHSYKEHDLNEQISDLRDKIKDTYYYPDGKDVVIKVNDQCYLISGMGIQSINLIESHE